MDYKNPDYTAEFKRRAEMLRRLRTPDGQEKLPALRAYYSANPIQFIRDWAVSIDPRNIERKLPALIPLVPFARQIEWMEWILDLWKSGKGGLTEKTRDMGCTVCAMSLFGTLAIFENGFVAGVGSRKEILVDRIGDPNTLFYKLRLFLQHVPVEFRAGWQYTNKAHNAYMNVRIPGTGSVVIGEAGDNIGRGGRTSIYLNDEKAFMRDQQSVNAALSQTTHCVIDLSSCNGPANQFAEDRHSGRVPVFTFHWRDDPRKSQEWYEAEKARLPAIIVAQEIDINYTASSDGVLIPQEWVQAAIGFEVVPGQQLAGVDVADSGMDKNALAHRNGNELSYCEDWSGNASDIFATSEKAVLLCDTRGVQELMYDADGLGVGMRGDLRIINDRRQSKIKNGEFRGSGAVIDPDKYVIEPNIKTGNKGRTNKEFFENFKAQSYWALRVRFENTFKYKQGNTVIDPATCISINPDIPGLHQLCQELSQPVYKVSSKGKIIIDKAPGASKSPNKADSVMIAFSPRKQSVSIFDL